MPREEHPVMSPGLERIAAKARQEPQLCFTSLAHHIDAERLWRNLCHVPRHTAPGSDGQTVDEHEPLKEQAEQINQGLRGHYAYYGIAGNVGSLLGVYRHVERYWREMLSSRSQKGKVRWEVFWAINSILKFFQVDSTGMFRMTSSARYFKQGVGSSRPNGRWIMCFLECSKANTSCTACVKRCSFS